MKKLFCFILIFCVLSLCSCKQEDLINVPIFISRFNKINDEKIQKNELCAVEENDILKYNFLLNENYLLTLTTDKQSGKIKSICVTCKNDKTFSENYFRNLCLNTLMSYEKISRKDAENILYNFDFSTNIFSKKIDFFYYSFVRNSLCISFFAESSRLNEEPATDAKLIE